MARLSVPVAVEAPPFSMPCDSSVNSCPFLLLPLLYMLESYICVWFIPLCGAPSLSPTGRETESEAARGLETFVWRARIRGSDGEEEERAWRERRRTTGSSTGTRRGPRLVSRLAAR